MKQLIRNLLLGALVASALGSAHAATLGDFTAKTLNNPSSGFGKFLDVNSTPLNGSAGVSVQFWGGATSDANTFTALTPIIALDNITTPGFATFIGFLGTGLDGNPAAQTFTIAGTTGYQNYFMQARDWLASSGSTFAGATVRGQSAVFSISLGGEDNSGNPANTTPILSGFGNFALAPVPEPATLTLGFIGLGGLLLRRRKQ